MIYVGLDVHKSFSSLATFDPATGELQERGKVASQWELLSAEVAHLPGEKIVVLEAGRTSHFLAAKLESVAQQVWIIDPGELHRLTANAPKTDGRDARAMARLAAQGLLPPLWRPSAQSLEVRELTRGKQLLMGIQTRVRNQLRALLARWGFEVGKGKDLLSEGVHQWLVEVAPQVPAPARQVLGLLTELLPRLVAAGKSLEPVIEQTAKAHPQAQRLQSLPGVGWYLALSMAVEIDDVARFADAGKLRSYAGLCPGVQQTGGRTHYGPLTKRGNRYLRYAAGLAAQAASRRRDLESRLRQRHTRVVYKHGKNPAKMELARALLTLAYHLLVQQEQYQPRPVAA